MPHRPRQERDARSRTREHRRPRHDQPQIAAPLGDRSDPKAKIHPFKIHRGQQMYDLEYRYLLIPVGYRIIVPPMTSEFLTIFKNSSLALTIGVAEVLYQARQIENYTFQGFEAFTAATLIYLVVTMIVVVIMDRVEDRTRIPGYGVQGKT